MTVDHQHRTAPLGRKRHVCFLLVVVITGVLLGCTGCGKSAGPSGSGGIEPEIQDLWPDPGGGYSTSRQGCGVLDGPAARGGTFVVALTDTVLPARAPIPHNDAERVLFGQLYETLVRVDCTGAITAGLAATWSCSADSSQWIFILREDARFWDGTRITSEDVLRSWRSNQGCPVQSDQTSPWTWFNAQARTVTLLDTRRLSIRLPEPQARFPMLLAHPATAVSAVRPGWTWPVGSGPARLRASDPPPLPELECRPNPQHPEPPVWKKLTFRVLPGADPRDLVTENFDLVVVRELAAVDFFEQASAYQVDPLPWDRLYLLVCPPETNPQGSARWRDAARSLDMERDLTAVSARDWSDMVFPAGGTERCPQISGPIPPGSSARLDWGLDQRKLDADVLAYDTADPAAREIAHRLSAVAGSPVRTAGLEQESLSFALQWQMAGAFIQPMPQKYPTGCLQLASLLSKAAWLQKTALGEDTDRGANNVVDAEASSASSGADPVRTLKELGVVRALGLTRPWLVTRGELGGLVLDFDGVPRLSGLGAAIPGEPAGALDRSQVQAP